MDNRSTRKEDFRRSIRYEEPQNRNKRRITGKGTVHNKNLKGKIMALLLAGIVTIGGCSAIKGQEDKTVKEGNISTISQMQEYNITPLELGVSQETYDRAIQLSQEIKEADLSNLSDEELADYFENLSKVQLKLVKEKVGNLIGKHTNEFELYAPNWDTRGERGGTTIYEVDYYTYGKSSDRSLFGHIDSNEMDEYMMDIADAQTHMGCFRNGTIKDRKDAERRLLEINKNTDGIVTINLLNNPTDKENKCLINTYRFAEQDFEKKADENVQVAGRESINAAGRESLSEEGR